MPQTSRILKGLKEPAPAVRGGGVPLALASIVPSGVEVFSPFLTLSSPGAATVAPPLLEGSATP